MKFSSNSTQRTPNFISVLCISSLFLIYIILFSISRLRPLFIPCTRSSLSVHLTVSLLLSTSLLCLSCPSILASLACSSHVCLSPFLSLLFPVSLFTISSMLLFANLSSSELCASLSFPLSSLFSRLRIYYSSRFSTIH